MPLWIAQADPGITKSTQRGRGVKGRRVSLESIHWNEDEIMALSFRAAYTQKLCPNLSVTFHKVLTDHTVSYHTWALPPVVHRRSCHHKCTNDPSCIQWQTGESADGLWCLASLLLARCTLCPLSSCPHPHIWCLQAWSVCKK